MVWSFYSHALCMSWKAANGGGAKRYRAILGGENVPQKVGFAWSVPVSSKENNRAKTNGEWGKRIIGRGVLGRGFMVCFPLPWVFHPPFVVLWMSSADDLGVTSVEFCGHRPESSADKMYREYSGRREKTPTPKTRFSIWTLLRTPGRFTTRPLPVYFITKMSVVRPFRSLVRTKLALSKTGCFLGKAEILGMGVFSPLSNISKRMPKKSLRNLWAICLKFARPKLKPNANPLCRT